jgi:hypothetical protein
MANTKLILRTLNSNFPSPFQDVTLNSVLSHPDLDNNFIYLKGELVYSGKTSGSTLTLNKINGSTVDIDLSGLVITGGTGGSGSTYTNSAATPTTIGGIPAGSTFSAQTMQQMWDALLYPYQPPSFTSFNRTNLAGVYELGDTLVGGSETFNWSTSNSSNVSPNTITIIENHTSTTLLSGGANDGSELLPTSPYSRTTAGTTLIYTITAQNTQSNTISTTISKNWRGRWYYGMNPNTSVTNGDITGTFNTTLTTGVVNGYVTWTPSGSEYGYLVIPNYLAQPSDLKDSVAGCFGNNIPFVSLGTTTFNNAFGVSQTYNVYRTVNAFNSPVNAWLCS